ncbi:Mannose-P-dolichol utilization defect 1 protein [Balamuthia mandrillaris]
MEPTHAQLLSKALSYGILAGSLVYKLPQILKIQQAKSAEGIAASAIVLELLGATCATIYSFNNGYSFLTYGESCFVILFDLFILYQIMMFSLGGISTNGVAATFLYAAGLYYCLSGALPPNTLQFLQLSVTPLVISSRIPQVLANYKNGSTGQLSFVTFFLNFGGSLARVFTTVTETADPLVLASYATAALLNGIILAQILYYWNVKPKDKKQ